MKLWGIMGAIVAIIILVFAAIYVSGALNNWVEQPGEGDIIAYIHPSATFRIDNTAVLSEEFIESIINGRAVVDVNAPAPADIFSMWNPKTGNVKMTFTINGVGTIEEQYQYSVAPLSFHDYSAETLKAFGMKTHGTYSLTMQLIDLPTNEIRDTYVVSVVV